MGRDGLKCKGYFPALQLVCPKVMMLSFCCSGVSFQKYSLGGHEIPAPVFHHPLFLLSGDQERKFQLLKKAFLEPVGLREANLGRSLHETSLPPSHSFQKETVCTLKAGGCSFIGLVFVIKKAQWDVLFGAVRRNNSLSSLFFWGCLCSIHGGNL